MPISTHTHMHTHTNRNSSFYKHETIIYILLYGFSHLITHTANLSESDGGDSVIFFLITIFCDVNEAHHI